MEFPIIKIKTKGFEGDTKNNNENDNDSNDSDKTFNHLKQLQKSIKHKQALKELCK